MSHASTLPSTAGKWATAVRNHGLDDHRLYDGSIEYGSASTANIKQFLLLRVLWTTHEVFELRQDSQASGYVDDRLYQDAKKLLKKTRHWKKYDGHLQARAPDARPELGTFSLVHYYQHTVEHDKSLSTQVHSTEKLTPLNLRTRAARRRQALYTEPSTPSKPSVSVPRFVMGPLEQTDDADMTFSPSSSHHFTDRSRPSQHAFTALQSIDPTQSDCRQRRVTCKSRRR